MTPEQEACEHRWVTRRTWILKEHRHRYQKCPKCQATRTITIPVEFAEKKSYDNSSNFRKADS